MNQEHLKGETPLILAMYGMIDTRCINLYIASGADMNSKMYNGETALRRAAWFTNYKKVEVLIKLGADVSSKTIHGETALHKAALHGSFKNVNLLLKAGADVNAQDEYYNTPLIMAVVLDCDDSYQSGREICLEVLLQAGAKINIINQDNLNAVQTHIRSSLFLYRKLNDRILQVLLAAGERSFSGADEAGLFGASVQIYYQKTSAESG